MLKALLVIAFALSLCQARPANFSLDSQELECGNGNTKCLNGGLRAVLPVERSWMETANNTIVPLLSIKREILHSMMHLNESGSESGVSLDNLVWSQDYAKRIVDTMTTEEHRRFVEPVREFVEKRNEFTREFADLQEDDFTVRGLDWTTQTKRVWAETENGSVVPLKRGEWLQLLNDSVVAPLKRLVEDEVISDKRVANETSGGLMDKRENKETSEKAERGEEEEQLLVGERVEKPGAGQFHTGWQAMEQQQQQQKELKREFNLDQSAEQKGMFSREFNDQTRSALNFLRKQRSLVSQNDTEFTKLCDGSQGFKYYQAHPTNETLYIQCDPWGQPIVRECETGLVWNQWKLNCTSVEELKNASLLVDGSEFDLFSVVQSLFDCTQPQYACLNGGSCTKLSTGSKFVCTLDFTGDVCEVKIDSSSIYSEILSGQFPFESYKKSLAAESQQQDDLKYFEQYKSSLSPAIYDQLVRYLSSYKSGEIRYDRLVSSLVEDVLQDIYPDALYLSFFNASQETVGNVVRMIPNLLSYGKYSAERYVQVFYQYQKTLNQLVGLLNSSWPTVKKEAVEYYSLTTQYLNNSLVLNNTFGWDERVNVSNGYSVQGAADIVTGGLHDKPEGGAFSFGSRTPVLSRKNGLGGGSGPVQWTEEDVMGKMRSEYNETLQNTTSFFELLEKFRTKALVEIKRNQKVVTLPLSEVNFDYAKETVEEIDDVSKSSMEIWVSLCNYGFWYLTNIFSEQRI